MNKLNVKLSVIIPVYNGSNFIEKCINSIAKYPYNDIEIIVVNDGSKDNTEEVCLDLCKSDNRIIYIKKENGGVSSARNVGIEVANGIYVMFVDCDDYLIDNWWIICKECIDNSDRDMCIMDYYREEFGRKNHIKIFSDKNLVSQKILIEKYVSTDLLNSSCGKLYKKSIIYKYDLMFPTDVKIGEDAIFVGTFINLIDKIEYISVPIYSYINNDNSASNTLVRTFRELDKLYYMKKEYAKKYKCSIEVVDYKFLGDLFSLLRTASINFSLDKFYETISSLKDYPNLLNLLISYKSLFFTRRYLQCMLFSCGNFRLLYYELRFEGFFVKMREKQWSFI